MWAEISSSVPHFLQLGVITQPHYIYKCLLKVLCPVSRPITTMDCVLLKGSNRALVTRSGPEINSRACLCVLQGLCRFSKLVFHLIIKYVSFIVNVLALNTYILLGQSVFAATSFTVSVRYRKILGVFWCCA